MRVLIVGAHPANPRSTSRYLSQMVDLWQSAGAQVSTFTYPELPRRIRSGLSTKYAAYIEKFILGSVLLAYQRRQHDFVHIVDHSDSLVATFTGGRRTVVTCHDLVAYRAAMGLIPGQSVKRMGRTYQQIVAFQLRRADHLVSVSAATAADISNLLFRKAVVIHNMVDPPPHEGVTGGGRGFLVVAGSGFRKNRLRCLQAYCYLAHSTQFSDSPLMILGPALTPPEAALMDEYGLGGRVTVSQGLSDEALWQLYASCAALISLGEHEGFCWPIIEAHSAGTPTLNVSSAVATEIAGQGAVYLRIDGSQDKDFLSGPAVAPALHRARAEARRNAERFARPVILTAWRELYERLELTMRVQ